MSTSTNGAPIDCPYQMWDGSYVLGSLSPVERREYEAHLDGCEHCSRAVRDLAGLPGLLGRIGPEVFEETDPEPVPDTLRPRLSRAVRRQQQRRTWLTASIAAAAAVAVTSAGVLALDRSHTSPEATRPLSSQATTAPSRSRPMTAVSREMIARVAVTPVDWGTKLELTCSYPRSAAMYAGGTYALVVHTKNGHTERVATWNGLPGKTMEVTGATAATRSHITSVEVSHLDGTPIAVLAL